MSKTTKARTKAEARRRKAGRPRNTEAERHPGGEIMRPGKEARKLIRLAETPAAWARLRAMGEDPSKATQERLREAASDARLVTLAGRLNACQRRSPKGSEGKPLLSAAAFRGIMQYGVAYEVLAKMSGWPKRHAKIGSYADPVFARRMADPTLTHEAKLMRAQRDYDEANRTLLKFPGGKSAVFYALDADDLVTPQSVHPLTVALLEKVGKALALNLWVL